MINYKTLTKYLTKLYIKQFFIASVVIISVLITTNTFDILQKFKSSNISATEFWELIFLRVPFLFNEVSALVCFIATFLFIRILTKQNEFIIILSSGVPAWRVFIVPILTSFFLGFIVLSVIGPVGSYALKSYGKLEKKINKIPEFNFKISQSGIFFFENFAGNNRIIQARSINATEPSLSDITILLIDQHNNLQKRIDAKKAILKTGNFTLINSTITENNSSKVVDKLNFPTKLSIDNLIQRFSPPEEIPIWNANNVIDRLIQSGFDVTKYQIYYYKQLFKPMTLMAISCIACCFVSLNTRNNSNVKIASSALITGVCVYFFLQMSLRILTFSGITPMLATLLPILFIILIGNFVILHFQEA